MRPYGNQCLSIQAGRLWLCAQGGQQQRSVCPASDAQGTSDSAALRFPDAPGTSTWARPLQNDASAVGRDTSGVCRGRAMGWDKGEKIT